MTVSKEVQQLREDALRALLRAITECVNHHDAKRAEEFAHAYASITQGEKTAVSGESASA